MPNLINRVTSDKSVGIIMIVISLILTIFSMIMFDNYNKKTEEYSAKCKSIKGVPYMRDDTYKCYVNGVNTKID